MNYETVLVTGGAGFIGSHIVDRLIRDKYRVVVADNFHTGDRTHVHPEAECVTADITSPQIGDLFSRIQPEYVIHQAAQASVAVSLDQPATDVSVNVLGTVNLLEAACRSGVKKFVFASSAAVYGEPRTLPIAEDHPPAPVSVYGVSKWAAERYIRFYGNQYGLSYAILRYANVYGPRQGETGEGGVVSIFTRQLVDGVPPTIYGTGEQTRDFIYVTDVAEANVKALTAPGNQTLNISTGARTSVNELFHQLTAVSGRRVQPQQAPPKPGDIAHSCLSNDEARRVLRWTPSVTLRDGLAKTYQYIMTQRQKAL